MSDCLFCRILEGEIPCQKVYEDEKVLAFNDINPQAPTHVLIIPKEHRADINALGESDQELSHAMFLAAQKIAGERGLKDHGYRLIVNVGEGAGQTVFHLHMHLLGGRPIGRMVSKG